MFWGARKTCENSFCLFFSYFKRGVVCKIFLFPPRSNSRYISLFHFLKSKNHRIHSFILYSFFTRRTHSFCPLSVLKNQRIGTIGGGWILTKYLRDFDGRFLMNRKYADNSALRSTSLNTSCSNWSNTLLYRTSYVVKLTWGLVVVMVSINFYVVFICIVCLVVVPFFVFLKGKR
jgi:hypothetical protein